MAGRPSKFTPSVVAAILENLRHGSPRGYSANAAGVSESTFFYWYAHGSEYQCEFSEFSDDSHARELMGFDAAVRMAEAVFVSSTVKRINRLSEKSWEAAAFMLERRFPSEFGRKVISDASKSDIMEQIEKLLPTESNPGVLENTETDLILCGSDEYPNIAALDKMARAAHGDYNSSYVGDLTDALKAERQRDNAFGQLLDAYHALRAQVVDQTMSA